jgi:hypothetical protein
MMTEATYEKLYREQSRRLEFIEQSLRVLTLNNGVSKWITEDEAALITGLSKRSLREKRKNGIFNWSSATGRKVKYLRKDVENYINNNSTLKK